MSVAGSGPRLALNAVFLPLPEFNVLDQPVDDVNDTRENWMFFVQRGCVPATRLCRSQGGPGFRECRAVHGARPVGARSTALGFGFPLRGRGDLGLLLGLGESAGEGSGVDVRKEWAAQDIECSSRSSAEGFLAASQAGEGREASMVRTVRCGRLRVWGARW